MRGDMYDIMSTNLRYLLEAEIKGKVSTYYLNKYDIIVVEISSEIFKENFKMSFKHATALIMQGATSRKLSESVLRSYKNWVQKRVFK